MWMQPTSLMELGVDEPGAAIGGKVPTHLKVVLGKDDVVNLGVFFAVPIPTIAGDKTGFVVGFGFFWRWLRGVW